LICRTKARLDGAAPPVLDNSITYTRNNRGRIAGDMKMPLLPNLVIFIAISIIVISTAAMCFFSYRYIVGGDNLVEMTLRQSIITLAKQYVDSIEQKIVDNDAKLYEMINVDEQAKWPEMAENVINSDLNVEQVYFLDPESSIPIYPHYSNEIRKQWVAFQSIFKLKELNLNSVNLNQVHHLHMERPNNYFFASFVLKETSKGTRILVFYQMSFDKIISLIDKNLRDLQNRYYVSIVDYDNNGVYGQPISPASKYFTDARFQTTFYKWILQLVPRSYTELEQDAINRRRTNLFFIIASTCLIFFSLAIIYMAWRRDRQLRQLKEDFISNVSHELKTPLSLIRMFSEILVLGRVKSEDKKHEYYRIIHNESDRMGRLINNLLDFAHLVRGIENKHFEKTNIALLVTEALEAFRYEVQKEGFQLNIEMPENVPDSYVDPNAITMALFNLLDNSVKYSGDQKEISVRIAQVDGFVYLSVTDKGVGIPGSEHSKIFDQFYRGNDPAIRRVRGSGIGLAITKHVAEIHGGEVLVESEPGKGSTFTLKIPIRRKTGEGSFIDATNS
jgi:two-component system, OmpR family, phosphate regulon sensor histidine kinase PhoR